MVVQMKKEIREAMFPQDNISPKFLRKE